MASDGAPATFQEDTDFGDLPQVAILGIMSTSDVTAADIESKINDIFYKLYTLASSGSIVQAGLGALESVRRVWRFMRENTDELTRTGFWMQLSDRILHDASIYNLGQNRRHALAVRELVFNLYFAYSQDGPTPLNLRYLRRKMIGLLDQVDSDMQARRMRPTRIHGLQTPPLGHRRPDTKSDCRARYTNLCAFASDLTREDIDLFAWEDIMTTAFHRARNNIPLRMSARGNNSSMNTFKAYMSGAEAWVNHNIVQKSLRNERVSHEEWRVWQGMFTRGNGGANTRALRILQSSMCRASREIERVLQGVGDNDETRHTHGSYTPRPRLLRIPAST